MKSRQQGVALITVLLVMSLALLLVGSLLRSHRLAVQSSAQQLHQLQLRQLGLSGETLARQYLQNPQWRASKTIQLGQEWGQRRSAFDIDGGRVHIHIEDLAGRFNINQLLKAGQVDQITLGRWSRLLQALNLNAPDLSALRPPDGPGLLSDVSGLRLLPGVDAHWLARIKPWIAVLPKEATLNVNTASATVLATLEGMTIDSAQALVAQRPDEGYSSVQSFTQAPAIEGLGVLSHGLGLNSRWFRVTVDAELGQRRLRLISQFERDLSNGRLRLQQRSFVASTESETAQ
ncbi:MULTISPECIES: general secretion pathway protein GspK [Pseudomonas]|uniref:Type II secretion system protein K n=1 Tax=Pseudomonas baetica TaxID=674054 RepID=A0ABX4PZ42_9PSED|nr:MULTISPECIES: type II secretion system protein GspK [Pseudomonas]PKA69793.1 general secretion pathway protein K [Pseudomonas baetica]PTC21446.1 type II secretory protein PulK [Pseudomonas baetica]